MRAKRIDANQAHIVLALRQVPGLSVALDHDDILVGYQGHTYWFEVKNKDGRNRIQPSQQKLINGWKGHYRVIHTLDDILIDLGITKT